MDPQNTVTLLVGVLVFIGSWYASHVQRLRLLKEMNLREKEVAADNSSRLVTTALMVVDPLEKRIAAQTVEIEALKVRIAQSETDRSHLTTRIAELEVELRAYEAKVALLEDWIRAQGVDPERLP